MDDVVELFSTVRAGLWLTGRLSESLAVAPWSEPASTLLTMSAPRSSSAWLTLWLALQVVVPAGARVVTRQTGAAAVLSSTRAMPVRVTLPVFVIR